MKSRLGLNAELPVADIVKEALEKHGDVEVKPLVGPLNNWLVG